MHTSGLFTSCSCEAGLAGGRLLLDDLCMYGLSVRNGRSREIYDHHLLETHPIVETLAIGGGVRGESKP